MKKSLIGASRSPAPCCLPWRQWRRLKSISGTPSPVVGELVKGQVADFNASQNDYVVVESHKGNYSETLNAGIAAFRAKEQPHPHGVRRHRDHDGRRRCRQAGL